MLREQFKTAASVCHVAKYREHQGRNISHPSQTSQAPSFSLNLRAKTEMEYPINYWRLTTNQLANYQAHENNAKVLQQ